MNQYLVIETEKGLVVKTNLHLIVNLSEGDKVKTVEIEEK